MLSVSPSSLPSHSAWLSENNPLTHDQNYLWTHCADIASQPLIQFSSLQSFVKLESCSPYAGDDRGGDPAIAKKLKHNASERNRRKKINFLYSSLRSLLPAADRPKRMSNPATISRALKYILELQQQVEGLKRRKEGLLTKVAADQEKVAIHEEKQRKLNAAWSPSSAASASWLSETEVVLQITSDNSPQIPFSQTLLSLEDDGLLLSSASSFQSQLEGRLFFTLHLQVKANSSRVLHELSNEKL